MPDNNNGSSFFNRFKSIHTETDKEDNIPPPSNNDRLHSKEEMTPFQAKWARKMVMEVNKFPYSNTKNIGLYSFNRSELEWYYKEIRLLADKVLDILECPYCEDTIKKAVMPGCGCDNPKVSCSQCWVDNGSMCLNCRRHCTSAPFEPVDEIIRQCHLFLKEKAFNKKIVKCSAREMKRICESYNQFLKHSEMELMCNYCFETLEKAITVSFPNQDRSQICFGCYESYKECYKDCIGPAPYPTFDQLNQEFSKLFSTVLTYCHQRKTPAYKDPYSTLKQPTKRVQRRYFKERAFKMFTKAIVFAACVYIFVCFVQ